MLRLVVDNSNRLRIDTAAMSDEADFENLDYLGALEALRSSGDNEDLSHPSNRGRRIFLEQVVGRRD